MRRVTWRFLCGVAAGVLALGAAAAGRAQPAGAALVVEDWTRQPLGRKGIPEGWQGQTWGSPRYDFVIVNNPEGRALHMKSDNEGSTISKEIKVDPREYPILQWRWKVTRLPRGGDSRRKETDDQAAQLYVLFPRFPAAVRSRVIGYVWDSTAPAGTTVRSQKSGTVTYIVVRSGEADLGRWITETRNVLEDYRRIYGEEPGETVGGVSVAIDSNDVKSSAEAFIGEIVFRKS